MAPFIKFTENIEAPGQTNRRLRFVNAEHIVEALWDDQTGELQLSTLVSAGRAQMRLVGQEAKDALKILQSL